MIGVFGGTGFIGRNLIEYFKYNSIAYQAFGRQSIEGSVVIDFDDPSTYRGYLERLTSVVLLVSASVPNTYAEDMPSEVERNVTPYARFLKAMEDSRIRQVVYISSGGAVYGIPETIPIRETHPTNPINPYGCGKLMIEEMIKALSARSGWTYTILRPSNPIGPHQSTIKGQGLVAKIIETAIDGGVLPVWGDGTAVRDYFDVRDLCEAINLTITHPEARNKILNVGSGSPLSVAEVIQKVESVLGTKIKVEYRKEHEAGIHANLLDCQKIRSLGWLPRRTFKESVVDMEKSIGTKL